MFLSTFLETNCMPLDNLLNNLFKSTRTTFQNTFFNTLEFLGKLTNHEISEKIKN